MRLEILVTETRDITLSRQRKTKVLIRLCRCASWSAPLLFAYDIRHDFSWPSSLVSGYNSSTIQDIKWTASSEFGVYRLCKQRRFRRACASAQSRQNLGCSLIQAVSQEEPSDRKPDPWFLWMAGHAQLKFVMTECSKTQIRLTGLKFKFSTFLSLVEATKCVKLQSARCTGFKNGIFRISPLLGFAICFAHSFIIQWLQTLARL